MTYRADPITQRDGSALANSNCRMASIATGLDYETTGGKTSTGSRMRSYTDDQSGGTDSGDAKQSWSRGYSEALRVMDGSTWADAVADLEAGRLVHLDVWAASVGSAGMCLSGSGAYGHTIAVAPEQSGSRWLVADPWCNPAKWQWCEASALQRGAQQWANEVGRAVTSGPPRPIAVVIRELLTLYRPDRVRPRAIPPAPDTGGSAIYYTTTGIPTGGGEDVRFINANGYADDSSKRLGVVAGDKWAYLDGSGGGSFSGSASLRVLGLVDSVANQYAVLITSGAPYADKVARDSVVLVATTRPLSDAPPPVPEPPPDTDPDAIRAERDAEWREWLNGGSPGWEG